MGYFQIGKITSTHGIGGTFRVFPTTEDASRFRLLKTILILHKGEKIPFTVERVSFQKNMVLLKVKEISDINVAEGYRNDPIYITDEQALPLEENEYYARDLYDMQVVTEDGTVLGRLDDIIETGANDVYVVKKEGEKDLLIPAIKECILAVDVPKKIMTVHLLEGLRQ